jgi:hypothetical protein
MDIALNFYELKRELEAMGFRSAAMVDDLRGQITDPMALTASLFTNERRENDMTGFFIHLKREEFEGRLSLDFYDGYILPLNQAIDHGT